VAEPTPIGGRVRGRTAGTVGGVVLAGGRSTRMGRDKAGVPWGSTTLLGYVLHVLADAVDGPLVVVGAADRPAPTASDAAPVVRSRLVPVADPTTGGGPLQGIATGLAAAAATGADRVFLASVDLPLLHPVFVRAVLDRLRDPVEVALPVLHGHRQPLAAAYVTVLGDRATRLLAAGATRPGELFGVSTVRELRAADLLTDAALAACDPDLDAVRGANTPAELAELAERARHRRRDDEDHS